jgi:hypothetical protein
LDGDGRPELVTAEFQRWANSCFSNAARPDWHSIYRLSPRSGGLVDVSSQFPGFYEKLYGEYIELDHEMASSSPLTPECAQLFKQCLINRAERLF